MLYTSSYAQVKTYILPPEAPRIKVTQQDIHVSVGADAVLECQATGAPTPHVHWFKGRSRST